LRSPPVPERSREDHLTPLPSPRVHGRASTGPTLSTVHRDPMRYRLLTPIAAAALMIACDAAPSNAPPEYAAVTLDGDSIVLPDPDGSPVLLNIWATWCLPCREEIPYPQRLHGLRRQAGQRLRTGRRSPGRARPEGTAGGPRRHNLDWRGRAGRLRRPGGEGADGGGRADRQGAPGQPCVRCAGGEGGATWAGVLPDGSAQLQPLIAPDLERPDPSLQTAVLLRSRSGSTRTDTIVVREVRTLAPGSASRTRAPGWPSPVAAVGAGGAYALGGLDARYRVLVHDSAGSLVRQICRDARGAPLRHDELGLEGDSLSDRNRSLRRVVKPDAPAPYARLILGVDGSLWVQRDRPAVGGDDDFGRPGAQYDVFNAEGSYLGEVRAPEGVTFQAAAGDTVWGFASTGGAIEVIALSVQLR
jgi:hypothetical protein